ncbi:glycine--tRNA ligase subunit beta, partial [Candidatus Aerophobetes bacterium]|nr:glycine--tRNA ligase subunit beta [Candidatus Aerophobetes bacterium]
MRQVAVLEIGVEDLPPQMVKDALLQLEEKSKLLLKEEKITFEKITSFGSSQRIGILIEGINPKQEDVLLKELGPPKNVVYDEKGNLTSAGKRYLMAKNLREEEIAVEKTEKGEYICIKKIIKGK